MGNETINYYIDRQKRSIKHRNETLSEMIENLATEFDYLIKHSDDIDFRLHRIRNIEFALRELILVKNKICEQIANLDELEVLLKADS